MTLSIGDTAPDFTTLDTQGNSVTLSQLQGQTVVLYFYPKDNTPGCTKEACSFRDNYTQFADNNIAVYGISPDSVKSHQKFTEKYDLPFPLLVDEDHAIADLYGVWGLKKFMGKEYMGIKRSTFVITSDSKVAQIYTKVKTASHATDILPDLLG